jgi:orotate phosphoribosyltransferase
MKRKQERKIMENKDSTRLINMLLESEAVQFGEFTLTSGRKSDYYCDIKKAMTRPVILGEIARLMSPLAAACGAQRIAGMELGAVPLAAALSLETGLPFLIVRKEGRSHGTGKRIEGEYREGERILIVEDVATTGGSMVRTADVLEGQGLGIAGAVVVVDREEGAQKLLRDRGIKLEALVTRTGLLESKRSP